MELEQLAANLFDFFNTNKVVLFRTEETSNFTEPYKGTIKLYGNKNNFEFTINKNRLPTYWKTFCNAMKKETLLITWDLKKFFSFLYFNIQKVTIPEVTIIDLKYAEKFLDIHQDPPGSFLECWPRLKKILENADVMKITNQIYFPLMTSVLPQIETNGLLNIEARKTHYSVYEIEGQVNGRLKSYKAFDKCFLPHSWSMEERAKYVSRDSLDDVFFVFDYKNLEPMVLSWLSKDEKLNEIINSGKDLYGRLYEVITGDVCDNDRKREIAKNILIPVAYGQGPSSLSDHLKIPIDSAKIVIDKVNEIFKVSMDWLHEQQEISDGTAKDYFGRIRKFPEEKFKIRNFLIQSTSAIICQEMLIRLHRVLGDMGKIVFFVHDAYGLACNRKNYSEFWKLAKKTLEEESEMCPGLKLRTSMEFGQKLNCLKRAF